MGDRDFFMTVLPLKRVVRYFDATPPDLPPELRSQRILNEKRVPEIADYVLDRDSDWVFGSLTASFDSEYEFVPQNGASGKLLLDEDAQFVIVDGQHRLAAIRRAIVSNPTLRDQSIGVMLIPFEDLERNQQVFSDLNRTVQKTSRSLDILYDHTDPLNSVVLTVGNRVPVFKSRVEKSSTSLALRSAKFVTLSSLYDACGQLLGGKPVVSRLTTDSDELEAAEEFSTAYWSKVTDVVEPWRLVRDEMIKPSEARVEYVATHSVAFYALGAVGRQLFGISSSAEWSKRHDLSLLDSLKSVDWAKTNPEWQGIVMLGSSIVTRRQTRDALTRRLLHRIDPQRFEDAALVLGD